MGKRLSRFKQFELVQKKNDILNRECDIVLQGNRTLHGTITEIKDNILYFRNMSKSKSELRLENIEEVILDTESVW